MRRERFMSEWKGAINGIDVVIDVGRGGCGRKKGGRGWNGIQ